MRSLTKIFSLVVVGASLLSVYSCQKKSDPQAVKQTNADLISASAWTYQDGGLDQNRDGAVDAGYSFSTFAPTLVPPCRIDNGLSFKKDNTGTVDEGATKCNAADAQTTTFNWSFADNESNLIVSGNVFALLNGKSRILSLTSTQFTLTRDTTYGSTTVPVVVILKH